jgi:acyl-coenzyme A synthetase/AMP-(fatty) acid ligase
MNAIAPIFHFARTRYAAPALVKGDRTVTYGEFGELVRRTSCHLASTGLRPGDRIGLCLKDSIDHLVAFFAVAHMGAVAVPLDWRAPPAENAPFIEKLGLVCVLAEPDARPMADCSIIALDAAWRIAVERAGETDCPSTDWGSPLVISASSGTTGAPKFTQMTHLQFHFAIVGMLELMGLSGQHRFLCAMPLYYSGGRNSCLAHLLRGDCVVLYPSLFTSGEFRDEIEKQRITVAGVVPSVVRQLLASSGDGPHLPGLTALFSTGATLHAEEKRQATRKLTPNFYERYGTAETMAISVLRPQDMDRRPNSVGQPHSFAEVEIVDDSDRTLLVNAVGRLRFRGPGLGSPLPGDAMANFRDGWYYPGEIARIDGDGYIFLQGRTSDVIIRSGAKVYPAEVERALLTHPEVAEAAVVGHRDDNNASLEEYVVAFVVPRGALAPGELLAHCRTRLTPHKVPREIRITKNLPRNIAGKIDKLALGKLLAGRFGAGDDQEAPGPG